MQRHILLRGNAYLSTDRFDRFDRSMSLWKRAMHLNKKNDRLLKDNFQPFTALFCAMVNGVGGYVRFTVAEFILECCLEEIQRDQKRLVLAENHIAKESFDCNIHTALYLLAVMIEMDKSDEEDVRFCRLVYRLNQLKLSLISKLGFTLLHMACDETTHATDDEDIQDLVQLPNCALVKLLLTCGADPNQIDKDGNTPLHILMRTKKDLHEKMIFMDMHQSITELIDAGVHIDRANHNGDIDRANHNGDIALKEVTTRLAERILRTSHRISLKCMAARVVHQHKIPYIGKVPQSLYEIIEMH